MPQFYFDLVSNGDIMKDTEGLGLADIEAAKREAIAALYAFATEAEPQVSSRRFAAAVRDESRTLVFEAELTLRVGQGAAREGSRLQSSVLS